MLKQYFQRRADIARKASMYEGFCPAAREMYARIADDFQHKAKAVVNTRG